MKEVWTVPYPAIAHAKELWPSKQELLMCINFIVKVNK